MRLADVDDYRKTVAVHRGSPFLLIRSGHGAGFESRAHGFWSACRQSMIEERVFRYRRKSGDLGSRESEHEGKDRTAPRAAAFQMDAVWPEPGGGRGTATGNLR